MANNGINFTDYLPMNSHQVKASGMGQIAGLSVINQSTATVGIWLSANADGLPDFQVLPGYSLCVPIGGNLQYFFVAYVPQQGIPVAGSVYYHVSPTPVAAAGAPGAGNSVPTGVWDQSTWDNAVYNT